MAHNAGKNTDGKRRRATSSESVRFDRPADSPDRATSVEFTTRQDSTFNNEHPTTDRTMWDDTHLDANEEQDALPSNLDAVQQFNRGELNAPVANMGGTGRSRPGPTGEELSVAPSIELSPVAEHSPMDIDVSSRSAVNASNWTKYKKFSKELGEHERKTSGLLQKMNDEHHNAIERGRKVAYRRVKRIEELEREVSALKAKLSSTVVNSSTAETWEAKYNMSQQALQMLTDDCNTWETKCSQLQRELNGIIVENSTADRDSRFSQEQVESMTRRLEECQEELKQSTKKARDNKAQENKLEEVLNKTDAAVIERVRILAKVHTVWKENGNERLKNKVLDQAAALVEAWSKFEGEFDAAMGGDN